MSIRLLDLIKKTRGAKTAAQERVIIKEESTNIRTAFKEGRDACRARNVNKLMYISLLGYPTDFGQVECIKLISSDVFREKKIGYLALTMLLDETSDILTLVEHQLKVDLASKNEHVRTMVLTTIANIAGEDMARDLSTEVSSCCNELSGNIRKRAFLAAVRCVRRVPTLSETFLSSVSDIFHEKVSNGVLISALALINECLSLPTADEAKPFFQPAIPQAIQKLKYLTAGSQSIIADRDAASDPFLQVKLLQFLRIIGPTEDTLQLIIEVLIKISTFTDNNSLASSAVLYECVKTIIAIDVDDLTPFAVTILGKFLLNKSNNMRYVALETFPLLVEKDHGAVMRLKSTIVECLTDYDDSIRKRALDLVYSLVDSNNVRALIPDLMGYLAIAKREFKDDLATKICTACDRFAPSMQWHIGTLLRLMDEAGDHVGVDAAQKFISLVSQSAEDVQRDTLSKLWEKVPATLDGDFLKKETLLLSLIWSVGEYTDFLQPAVPGDKIMTALRDTLYLSSTPVVKQYCLNALLKASVRLPAQKQIALEAFAHYQNSSNTELQQRAWEYQQMLLCDDASIAASAAGRMPVMEENSIIQASSLDPAAAAAAAHVNPVRTQVTDTGFLDSIFGDDTQAASTTTAPAPSNGGQGVLIDDIFGTAPPVQQQQQQQQQGYRPPYPVICELTGLSTSDVEVKFYVMKHDQPGVLVVAVVNNKTAMQLSNVEVLAAVTKTATLQMHPKEQSHTAPHSFLTQPMTIVNNAEPKPVALKLRLSYTGAVPVSEDFTVSGLVTIRS
eukprot:TRINITY_DN428_c4_g1_i1.p1 TRINITY_DN428_c4_g1~~TRINITY_DN428_c4_g1_i1.p1  ORF type:complete len:788 (+),score=231.89 TRINITY_DN428_c4_g1_i1:125-2488(+)